MIHWLNSLTLLLRDLIFCLIACMYNCITELECVADFIGCLEWGSCCWLSMTPLQLSPKRPHERGGGLHQPSLQCTAPDNHSCRGCTFIARPCGDLSRIFRIFQACDHRRTLIHIHRIFLSFVDVCCHYSGFMYMSLRVMGVRRAVQYSVLHACKPAEMLTICIQKKGKIV